MSKKFDAKIFNEEAFGKYISTIPDTSRVQLLQSGAVRPNDEIFNLFQGQVNSYYGRIPYFGRIDGDPVNYDGQTDITATSLSTFDRGVLAYGRAKAWTEKDFSYDITSGVDFMSQVGQQVVGYWAKIDQSMLLKLLGGIFGMTTPKENKAFVDAHTLDVSGDLATKGKVAEDTLNNALQKACGDNKNIFSLIIMHSQVATNLENINLMKRWTQTDANGLTRELSLGSWNGKTVLIDDSMPTEKATEVGSSAEEGTHIPAGTKYTTYVLGQGAIEFGALPVKRPYEMDRDPAKNGGEDTLYSRKRNYLGVAGLSYEKKSQASLSATDKEIGDASNWTLINDGKTYIDHKAIPMARIISRG